MFSLDIPFKVLGKTPRVGGHLPVPGDNVLTRNQQLRDLALRYTRDNKRTVNLRLFLRLLTVLTH
jgi:hypothetical protein